LFFFDLFASIFRGFLEKPLNIDLVVPNLESSHKRIISHPLAIRTHRCRYCRSRFAFKQVEVTPRNSETGGQALEIPFLRCWKRLVEIVDVEDDVSFRCSEAAKVHQMAVAASLNGKTGCWSLG